MWGWRAHPAPVSCEPEAVARAQHVFVLWRGLGSLLKKKNIYICKGGWLGYESYTARKISPNCWERSHLTELCFSLVTYAPFSDCWAMRGAKIKFYSLICGLREEVGQNTPRLILFLAIKIKPCGNCLLSFETWDLKHNTSFGTKCYHILNDPKAWWACDMWQAVSQPDERVRALLIKAQVKMVWGNAWSQKKEKQDCCERNKGGTPGMQSLRLWP